MTTIADVKVAYWRAVEVSSSVPVGRSGASSVMYNDPVLGPSILVFGGHRGVGGVYCDALLQFSFSMQAWQVVRTEGTPPSPRAFATVVMHNQKEMYVWGGWDGVKVCNDMFKFDCEEKKWKKLSPSGKIVERFGCSSVLYNESIYVFGGENVDGFTNELYEFNINKKTWKAVKVNGAPPPSRGRASAALFEHCMFIFGGQGVAGVYNDLWVFSFKDSTWTQLKFPRHVPPPARCDASCVVHNGCMYVFGGAGMGGRQYYNDMFEFNFSTQSWRAINVSGIVPVPRSSACAVVHNSSLFIFFGGDGGVKNEYNELHELSLDPRVQEALRRQVQDAEAEMAIQREMQAMRTEIQSLQEQLERARAERDAARAGGGGGGGIVSAKDQRMATRQPVLDRKIQLEVESQLPACLKYDPTQISVLDKAEVTQVVFEIQKQLLEARAFRDRLIAKFHSQESEFLRTQLKTFQREREFTLETMKSSSAAPEAVKVQKMRQERDLAYTLLQESQRTRELLKIEVEQLKADRVNAQQSRDPQRFAGTTKKFELPNSITEEQRRILITEVAQLLGDRTALAEGAEIRDARNLTVSLVQSSQSEMEYAKRMTKLSNGEEDIIAIKLKFSAFRDLFAQFSAAQSELCKQALSGHPLDADISARRDTLLGRMKEASKDVTSTLRPQLEAISAFSIKRNQLVSRLESHIQSGKWDHVLLNLEELSFADISNTLNLAEELQTRLGAVEDSHTRVCTILGDLRAALEQERENIGSAKKFIMEALPGVIAVSSKFFTNWTSLDGGAAGPVDISSLNFVTVKDTDAGDLKQHHAMLFEYAQAAAEMDRTGSRRDGNASIEILKRLKTSHDLVVEKNNKLVSARQALETALKQVPPPSQSEKARLTKSVQETDDEVRAAEAGQCRVVGEIVEVAVESCPELFTQKAVVENVKKYLKALMDPTNGVSNAKARDFLNANAVALSK